MKKPNFTDDACEVLGVVLLTIFLLLAMAWYAFSAEPRVMRAVEPLNGGRIAYNITEDGKTIIQKFADGTITTNALKFANTPIDAVPKIESALRKQIIVSAALAEVSADVPTDAKLQLAAERATESLRVRSAGTLETDGGEIQPPIREQDAPTTPPTKEKQ